MQAPPGLPLPTTQQQAPPNAPVEEVDPFAAYAQLHNFNKHVQRQKKQFSQPIAQQMEAEDETVHRVDDGTFVVMKESESKASRSDRYLSECYLNFQAEIGRNVDKEEVDRFIEYVSRNQRGRNAKRKKSLVVQKTPPTAYYFK